MYNLKHEICAPISQSGLVDYNINSETLLVKTTKNKKQKIDTADQIKISPTHLP